MSALQEEQRPSHDASSTMRFMANDGTYPGSTLPVGRIIRSMMVLARSSILPPALRQAKMNG